MFHFVDFLDKEDKTLTYAAVGSSIGIVLLIAVTTIVWRRRCRNSENDYTSGQKN